MKSRAKRTFTALVALSLLLSTLSQSQVNATSTSALFFNINAGDPASYSTATPAQWNDLSTAQRNGTIVGTLNYNSADRAIEFPGNANSYVDMGTGFNNFGNGFTIEFEGHFGTVNQGWERIFDFGNGPAADNIWVGVFGDDANELAIEIWDGSITKGRCATTQDVLLTNVGGSLRADTFSKYVITMDGTVCRIYKNGTEVNTKVGNWNWTPQYVDDPNSLASAYPFLPVDINVTRTNNYIGKSNWVQDPAFNGALKYVRIYTAALTGNDVAQNAQTYTLTYATTDAGNGTAPASRSGNGLMSLDGNTGSLTRNGYTFEGWATSPGQTTPISGFFNLVSNSELHPVWSPNTLTVTYNTHGGSAVAAGSTVSDGSINNSPGTPTRDGFLFAGWFTASSGGTAITFPYSHEQLSDFTLHAQWTEQPNNQVTPTPPGETTTQAPSVPTISDASNTPSVETEELIETDSSLPSAGTESSGLLLFAFAVIVGGVCLLLQRRQLAN